MTERGESADSPLIYSVARAALRGLRLRRTGAAARADARSTAGLTPTLRSRSRGADLLPPFGRETFRAAN